MRLISLAIGIDTPFWFFKNIQLTKCNPRSNFIDTDILEEEDRRVINLSLKQFIIKAFDQSGRQIYKLEDLVIRDGDAAIKINDSIEEDDNEFSFACVTCSLDDNTKEEIFPIAADYKEAEILLNQNGHTVKKAILNIQNSDKNIGLLKACLEIEQKNKQRKVVLDTLKDKLSIEVK